ncbi:hypothetical protein [Streptomyces sp. NPDC003036]
MRTAREIEQELPTGGDAQEGRDAWQGKGCCAAPAAAVPPAGSEQSDTCG